LSGKFGPKVGRDKTADLASQLIRSHTHKTFVGLSTEESSAANMGWYHAMVRSRP
jgi:hypothetical protein